MEKQLVLLKTHQKEQSKIYAVLSNSVDFNKYFKQLDQQQSKGWHLRDQKNTFSLMLEY
jgi:hypothetical protein